MAPNTEHDALISSYEHLPTMPRAADALHTIRKIASLVKPIMRKHGWRVRILSEFYPDDQRLLGINVNHGHKICLRLRYPNDNSLFLPTEEVVDTMLHELSHNVFGPHDDKFHKLWEDLRDEYEELAIKGFTGDGFLSEGQRLGGRNLPIQEMRRQARAAAQLRKERKTGFSQRLGGAPVDARADIRSIIADAASRRMRITSRGDGCASNSQNAEAIGDEASQNGFRTEAEEKDANDRAISQALWELVQEEEARKAGVANWKDEGLQWNPSTGLQPASLPPTVDEVKEEGKTKTGKGCDSLQSPPSKRNAQPVPDDCGSSTASPSPPPKTKRLKPDIDDAPIIVDLTNSPSPPPPTPTTWSCEICTLVNPMASQTCNACESARPASLSNLLNPPRIKVKDEPISKSKPNRSDKLLVPRRSGALISAAEAEARAKLKPKAGWVCTRCGNWTEAMFWSCGGCGNIKERS